MMARYRPDPKILELGPEFYDRVEAALFPKCVPRFVNERYAQRADILWEKGTNRSQFFRGQTDKYTWLDVGSSYLPSELTAAFLHAQLERADDLVAERTRLWNAYHIGLADLERLEILRRPIVPPHCQHNAHIYYVLLPSAAARTAVLASLRGGGIDAVFHYVPLHSSPAGRRFGRAEGELETTTDASDRLIRLPLWVGMTNPEIDCVLDSVRHAARAAIL